jgi:transposase
MRKLLRLEGCWIERTADVAALLAGGKLRRWDGSALPQELVWRLEGECKRLAHAQEQLKALESNLPNLLPQPVQQRIAALQKLAGVGPAGSIRFETEFAWRQFTNRRQVGAALGLVPQPYDSGQSHQDQGISKASNRRVRSLMIEMAWMWVRYQPDSEITKWYLRRTEGAGKRMKRVAIVALARRLAIALWRYVTDGVVPAGAALKKA